MIKKIKFFCFSFPSGKSLSPAASFLSVLKSASGDYEINSCCQLRLPGDVEEYSGGTLTSSVNAIRWSPHRNASTIGVAFDSGVLGIDIRSMQ